MRAGVLGGRSGILGMFLLSSERDQTLPNKLFQRFETTEVETAFQKYQAERGVAVVYWIMLGGISVGLLFGAQGLGYVQKLADQFKK